MSKTVEEICNNIIQNITSAKSLTQKDIKTTLSASIEYCSNNFDKNECQFYYTDDHTFLEKQIIKKLALAIDENSVYKIKKIKQEYGNLKEYSQAKKYLNEKCKEVYNVHSKIKKLPKEAMKTLGITNCPDINTLLYDSIKYYEKENSSITSLAIKSILNNPNMNYEIDDIYKYFVKMHKNGCTYNLKTLSYFLCEHKFSIDKLTFLCANKKRLKELYKILPLKIKLKELLNYIKYCY